MNSGKIQKYTIFSPYFDGFFLFFPFVAIFLFTLVSENFFPEILNEAVSPLWFFLVLIIFDVGHVWATMFRTYFRKDIRNSEKQKLTIIPIFSFGILLILALLGQKILPENWQFVPFVLLAYMAVFHFMKQQVGFIMLYKKREYMPKNFWKFSNILEKIVAFSITLFPFLDWMMHYNQKNFEWFMAWEFQFLANIIPQFSELWLIFTMIIAFYILAQTIFILAGARVNPLKYLYILGTFGVWYSGMVVHNNVFIFGVGNVVLHAMNYYGITFGSMLTTKKSFSEYWQEKILSRSLLVIFIIFLAIVVGFAFVEEYFWDQFFWQNQGGFFGKNLYNLIENQAILAIIFAILGTIQLSHYILDRYIWRKNFGKIM